jgi:hypothetical protein
MTRSLFGPDDDWTLAELRDWLNSLLQDGVHCPCCGQYAKLYRRKINAGMARALIVSYRIGGGDYVHVTQLGSHEIAQLQWWQLVEEMPAKRPDGGRTGWWRPTGLGMDWIYRRARVPKYVLVYDGALQAKPHGDPISVADALGSKFNLADLMEGL